jgi:hypothetical protein
MPRSAIRDPQRHAELPRLPSGRAEYGAIDLMTDYRR